MDRRVSRNISFNNKCAWKQQKGICSEYVRTSAAVTEKINDRVKNEPARKVYCDMVLDDSMDAPRNLKQVNKY